MAFAQQRRRPTTLSRINYDSNNSIAISSDSEDWHVLSSAASSPILFPTSESETSRQSDTESDLQTSGDDAAYLPSHDGTGTFIVEDTEFFSSDQQTTDESEDDLKSAIENLTSDQSILEMILQQGSPPSFATKKPHVESLFEPTVIEAMLSADEEKASDVSDNISEKSLDRIPTHHPTSIAILSIVWDNLKRFTNHILENDTNTVETISTLMSEAVFEGCIPFGSHLHMDIEHPRSLLEGA